MCNGKKGIYKELGVLICEFRLMRFLSVKEKFYFDELEVVVFFFVGLAGKGEEVRCFGVCLGS